MILSSLKTGNKSYNRMNNSRIQINYLNETNLLNTFEEYLFSKDELEVVKKRLKV